MFIFREKEDYSINAKRVLNNEISLKPSEKSAIKLKLDEYSKHSYTI